MHCTYFSFETLVFLINCYNLLQNMDILFQGPVEGLAGCLLFLGTTDPWTTQVLTMQIHLSTHYFNKYTIGPHLQVSIHRFHQPWRANYETWASVDFDVQGAPGTNPRGYWGTIINCHSLPLQRQDSSSWSPVTPLDRPLGRGNSPSRMVPCRVLLKWERHDACPLPEV